MHRDAQRMHRLFDVDGAGMCWTFGALARWLARRVRLGSPEGRAGGQLSPQRSIDNSMTAQKQLAQPLVGELGQDLDQELL